ncbi:MAG: putative lipid II flippase FtsW [Nitrosomonas sp.]|jgi:cell division protein FtsW|uniref:putative lipid II flippase FtsW n=1 Tax=Nitrosomonas sp. TaxID=42353 RepID=UPI00271EE076|nr:putative lipid II flippase FtsW [Nitrosomonas sp.]MBK6956980.1 putative lipid II flippase FtsW [Nitrosomonas sp.]MDO8895452.1 putative lipid II flippase FtsW [Nitrosomonas sp.]MDP1550063.1 putative lipid II flippase FtsW [Nitrosomonas sp.]MDP1787927.1 putative lipid II flippase FtsW [Nitrosomonas sp.]MDP1933566.1 putative lipid II flippase FtsW [Nitrosomonas sp.]
MIYQANNQKQRVLADFDQALVWSVVLLLSIGLIMIYSASIAIAEAQFGADRAGYYLLRHSAYLAVGLLLGLVTFQVPMRIWQKYVTYLFMISVLMLVLVLIPGIGHEVNGSQRWISLYVVNIQPSEFVKLFMVLYTADYVSRKAGDLNSFLKGFLPITVVLSIVGFLLLLEPDFGAFFVVTALVMSILFLGGVSLKIFIALIGILAIGLYELILSSEYRMARVVAFMDPWADPYGKGYQLSHALIAFGRGEWFGVGLGGSVEKLFYLPEAHTDFLLSVLAEELGFVGVAAVILLFVWLIMRAFVIGRLAAKLGNPFSALAAQGIGIWIGVQALINMGVNMGVLPTKGLTLPLLSFGGSSITANCIALAVILRIDWENRQRLRGLNV